ncbi:hypothetical protein HNR62_000379 [Oceanisphaera litoralis]|uniref:anti-virulence regulator CigR family protein n=1 Tax=Oceanisphaera litoralis TaxID=225144 RepID=UPI001EF7DEED|nr:anti-virulence regulator CigR family protein [Oceanisphaera litoralis]MBM7454550.1 hypothetical protein [Oceanisphaera litoralis]
MKASMILSSLLFTGLLLMAPLSVQAQPPEGKGPDKAPGQQKMQKELKEQKWRNDEYRERNPEYRRGDVHDRDHRHEQDRDWRGERRYPDIDEVALRLIFREHRSWVDYDRRRDALPPGIRKNLQQGKPLPPGIAKRFDPRLRERLPYYEGHEWRRAGDKAILVELATDNVRFILESIFD